MCKQIDLYHSQFFPPCFMFFSNFNLVFQRIDDGVCVANYCKHCIVTLENGMCLVDYYKHRFAIS